MIYRKLEHAMSRTFIGSVILFPPTLSSPFFLLGRRRILELEDGLDNWGPYSGPIKEFRAKIQICQHLASSMGLAGTSLDLIMWGQGCTKTACFSRSGERAAEIQACVEGCGFQCEAQNPSSGDSTCLKETLKERTVVLRAYTVYSQQGLDIAPSSSAVLAIGISMLSALDHLLGTSCETLIGFEDEAEVENSGLRSQACTLCYLISFFTRCYLVSFCGCFFMQEGSVTKDVAKLTVL
ncbi:hypothetical protein EDD85DRAFT_943148 [Armillaria nabsnona]|nr:hypothetical protein EDD85DRAFT_943148 [Armillaria nabsnona]